VTTGESSEKRPRPTLDFAGCAGGGGGGAFATTGAGKIDAAGAGAKDKVALGTLGSAKSGPSSSSSSKRPPRLIILGFDAAGSADGCNDTEALGRSVDAVLAGVDLNKPPSLSSSSSSPKRPPFPKRLLLGTADLDEGGGGGAGSDDVFVGTAVLIVALDTDIGFFSS